MSTRWKVKRSLERTLEWAVDGARLEASIDIVKGYHGGHGAIVSTKTAIPLLELE